MDKKDYKAFEKIMASLNELYGDPGKKVSDLKMELYFTALKDLTVEQLNDAVNALIQTKTMKIWPLPGEIRQAVEGSPQDVANRAFDELLGAVRSIGPYRSVSFADRAIHVFIESYGGWAEICDKTVDEWKFMRNEFVKGYAGYARRAGTAVVSLAGIHESQNRLNGYRHEAPLAIIGGQKALSKTGSDA